MAASDKTARFSLSVAIIIQPIVSLFYFRLFHIVLFVGLIGFLLVGGYKRIRGALKNRYAICCMALFVFPFVTYFWSLDPESTFYRSTVISMHIPLFILAISAMFYDPKRQPYVLITLYVCTYILVSVYILLTFGSLRADSYSMKQATGAFSNIASSAVLCCLPFFMSTKNRVVPAIVNHGILLSSIAIILLSQSRSALGLSGIALCLGLIVIPDRLGNRYIKFVIAGFMFFSVAIYVGSSGIGNQFLSGTLERLQNSQLLSGSTLVEAILNPDSSADDYTRTLMYNQGWELIRNNWLTGAGFGALKTYMESNVGRGTISHNWIITALGELGLVGFIIMCFVMIYSLYKTYSLSRSKFLPLSLRIFSAQLFVALFILFLQSMTRPLYPNPLFSLLLAFSVWIVLCTRSARYSDQYENS